MAKQWRSECERAAKDDTTVELGKVRIDANATEVEGSSLMFYSKYEELLCDAQLNAAEPAVFRHISGP